MRSIQTSLEWLKGQYALKICQTPAARLVWKSLRETGGDRRLSRRDLARYLRSGAGVCGIARDRTADRELFAVISLDLGGIGANRRRDEDRHRADWQRWAAPDRYPRDPRRSGHLGAAARRLFDELDCGGAAGGAAKSVGAPRCVRAGLDRRARWKARRDALALLSETCGWLPKHSRRAKCDFRQG